MKKFKIALHLALLSFVLLAFAACNTSYKKLSDGIQLKVTDKTGNIQSVRLQVMNEKIIKVTAVPGKNFPEDKSLMLVDTAAKKTAFDIAESGDTIFLKTNEISAGILKTSGEVFFRDKTGKIILAEKHGGGKTFAEDTIENKIFYSVSQQFENIDDEGLYGLGANQTDFLNLKGKDADLFQYNTQAVIPFLVSTNNYGILWDNNSRSKFGDKREFQELTSLKLYDSKGAEGSLTATYSDKKDKSKIFLTRPEKEISYQFIPDLKKFPANFKLADGMVTWEGSFSSDIAGIHKMWFTSAGYVKMWIDGKLVYDYWRQCWNTRTWRFDFPMEAGKKYALKIEWIPDGGESFIAFKHLDPQPAEEQNRLSLYSETAEQLDYYFVYGTTMDEIISGYRSLTGKSPVMPKWAMGFWQSRQRYKTQDEILDVVNGFRSRNIPFDNIVLDWQYWPIDKWGDHEFDPTRFDDPSAMMKTLHDSLNSHLMISVWAKYYKGTKNYDRMNEKGWLYKRNIEENRKDWLGYISTFYDAFNADARLDFWNQINEKLFSKGVDAWWMDATEPDITSNMSIEERKLMMNPTALGPASQYFNAFSIEQAKAVYEGQRKTNPDQRVYILTRSGFGGLQRYAAANWSGDIASRWHDMQSQIPCGLSFCISGIPYWTMDIGGFSVETRFQNPNAQDLEEWREMQTRWLQFGTFAPIFRSHGEFPYREMWNIAPENHQAYKAMLASDKLRYRLIPYIYSLTGMTWLNDYTIMRAMVMDFGKDKKVRDIKYQFMFGPALMVNPVCEYKARSREVYLPEGTGWYDLYSGKYYPGGQTINADAPYQHIPLYFKEGSIVPVGPEIQFSTQKNGDTITLFVFTGKDASFTLYEDENVNYNYEKGAFALIPFTYNNASGTLTIGNRSGTFSGMLQKRVFKVVFITPETPEKLNFDARADQQLVYEGKEIKVTQ